MRLLLALWLLVFAMPAMAQSQYTHAQLRDLDTPAIAKLLLGASGERMVEHHIGARSCCGASQTVHAVTFAGTPAGSNGICVADEIHIEFHPVKVIRGEPDLPVRVHQTQMRKRWAMLPRRGVTCAALGSVLDRTARPSPYFNARDAKGAEIDPATAGAAVALLRKLLAAPRSFATLRCDLQQDARQAVCDARHIDDLLKPDQLAELRVSRCDESRIWAGSEPLCVNFRYDDPSAETRSGSYLNVTFVTDGSPGAALTEKTGIVRVHISKVIWVA